MFRTVAKHVQTRVKSSIVSNHAVSTPSYRRFLTLSTHQTTNKATLHNKRFNARLSTRAQSNLSINLQNSIQINGINSRAFPRFTSVLWSAAAISNITSNTAHPSAESISLKLAALSDDDKECIFDLDDIETVASFDDFTSQKGLSAEELFPHLPVLCLEEIRSVTSHSNPDIRRILIVQGDYLYDVTDFIAVHPGGDRILNADGGFADPFWNLYSVHRSSPTVWSVLQASRVGILERSEREAQKQKMAEFAAKGGIWQFEKDRSLNNELGIRQFKPCNAESPLHRLADTFITPLNLWFIRNHHPVPISDQNPPNQNDSPLDPNTVYPYIDKDSGMRFLPHSAVDMYPIEIAIAKKYFDAGKYAGQSTIKMYPRDAITGQQRLDAEPIEINLDFNPEIDTYTSKLNLGQLKYLLPQEDVVNTIICSGNRRSEMSSDASATEGLGWSFGAMSTGQFSGIKIAALWDLFGVNYLNLRHFWQPSRYSEPSISGHLVVTGTDAPFDTSVPMSHALDPDNDVMIALELNNELLEPDQGYPAKLLLPGMTGNRQVKWLDKLALLPRQAVSPWHTSKPYRYTGPATDPASPPQNAPPVYSFPVFSVVLQPVAGTYAEKTGIFVPELATVHPHGCSDRSLIALQAQLLRQSSSQNNAAPTIEQLRSLYQCIDAQGTSYVGSGVGIARVDTGITAHMESSVSPSSPMTKIDSNTILWTEATLNRGSSDTELLPISDSTNNLSKRHWAHSLWSSEIVLPRNIQPGDRVHISSKAIDNQFNTQPRDMAPSWNARGILTNAWHVHPVIIGESVDKQDCNQL